MIILTTPAFAQDISDSTPPPQASTVSSNIQSQSIEDVDATPPVQPVQSVSKQASEEPPICRRVIKITTTRQAPDIDRIVDQVDRHVDRKIDSGFQSLESNDHLRYLNLQSNLQGGFRGVDVKDEVRAEQIVRNTSTSTGIIQSQQRLTALTDSAITSSNSDLKYSVGVLLLGIVAILALVAKKN